MDSRSRRVAQRPRLHAILAGHDWCLAMASDSKSPAGDHSLSELVSILALQFRPVGARDHGPARRDLCAATDLAIARWQPIGRALSVGPRQFQLLRPHQACFDVFTGATVSNYRPRSARRAICWRSPGAGECNKDVSRVDDTTPGCRWRLGRHPTAMDLRLDRTEKRGLRIGSSGHSQRSVGTVDTLVIRPRWGDDDPGD